MTSADERPAKRARIDYSDSIEVLIGPEETFFVVYKDVITKRSPFFRAALAHNFKEAQEKRVRLPECDIDTFNRYLDCVYSGFRMLSHGDGSKKDYQDQCHLLFKLYILADQLRDIRFCNDCLDWLIHMTYSSWNKPRPETVHLVYDTFPRDHKLRDFIVAFFMDQSQGDWLAHSRDSLPRDFLAEFAICCDRQIREEVEDSARLTLGERCAWHEHDEEVTKAEYEVAGKPKFETEAWA